MTVWLRAAQYRRLCRKRKPSIEPAMRMLLVEDEKKVSELVARALRAERY